MRQMKFYVKTFTILSLTLLCLVFILPQNVLTSWTDNIYHATESIHRKNRIETLRTVMDNSMDQKVNQRRRLSGEQNGSNGGVEDDDRKYYEQDRREAEVEKNGNGDEDTDDDTIDKNFEYKPPTGPSIPSNLDKNFTHFSTRRPYTQKEKLTVVITTYKQQYCLERNIMLLRSCTDVVAEIRVNWFVENEEPTFQNEYTTNHSIPVVFDKYPDKLSYRFHPRNFTTDAVFSMDVDMFYSCESLDKALYTWHQVENSAVGFHGRRLKPNGEYRFLASYESPLFRYNTVFITKGGITHKDMFHEYFRDEYRPLRDIVDEHTTAEDILMSLVLDLTNTQIIMTCPEVHNICMVHCHQGKMKSLVERTSTSRKNLTISFCAHFRKKNQPVFDTHYEGENNVVWQLGKPQEECMSLNKRDRENTPFCVNFCEHNLICPSSVGQR